MIEKPQGTLVLVRLTNDKVLKGDLKNWDSTGIVFHAKERKQDDQAVKLHQPTWEVWEMFIPFSSILYIVIRHFFEPMGKSIPKERGELTGGKAQQDPGH